MQLVIDTANTSIKVRNKSFFIENKQNSRQISPLRVSSIAISVNATINTSAMKLATLHNIPIYIFNRAGRPETTILAASHMENGLVRSKQYDFVRSIEAQDVVKALLILKTANQIHNLRWLNRIGMINSNSLQIAYGEFEKYNKKLAELPIPVERNLIFGIEGNLSKLYFSYVRKSLPPGFQFERRSRRPARDRFNALLNYIYGCTYTVVHKSCLSSNLDPYIGMLHAPGRKSMSLVYDLIEPIRPLMDRLVLQLVFNPELKASDITENNTRWTITKGGKRIIIVAFHDYLNKRVKMGKRVTSVENHIYSITKNVKNRIDQHVPSYL